jgi:hypothetical protein
MILDYVLNTKYITASYFLKLLFILLLVVLIYRKFLNSKMIIINKKSTLSKLRKSSIILLSSEIVTLFIISVNELALIKYSDYKLQEIMLFPVNLSFIIIPIFLIRIIIFSAKLMFSNINEECIKRKKVLKYLLYSIVGTVIFALIMYYTAIKTV